MRRLVLCLVLAAASTDALAQRKDDGKGLTVEPTGAAATKWAVVIGINQYVDSTIPGLEYSVADAELVARTLVDKCGYEQKRILLLADTTPPPPAHMLPLQRTLQQRVPAWLENAQAGDTVLVFFSGHGFLGADGKGYLAPQDCLKADLQGTGYPTESLRKALADCAATQKLLVLDCCHAGGEKAATLARPSSQEIGQAFSNAAGLVTLASCRKEELSREWRAKRQGLFTYYLAEGLGGSADFDRNGIVDSDELYRYTFENVPLTAQRELNAQQRPVRIIREDALGVFALARVGPRAVAGPRHTNSVGMSFVRVDPGEFSMGNSEGKADEQPAHRIRITRPFYIGVTEVTQGQYEQVTGARPSYFSAGGEGAETVAGQNTAEHPVEQVSHAEAVDFCRRLAEREGLAAGAYRLPTEAEWEMVARQADGDLDARAWLMANAGGRTHPVGTRQPNALGVYDMLGNVAEWCGDWYEPSYYVTSPIDDPAGPESADGGRRVVRGGSWIASPRLCHPAARQAAGPDDKMNCYGFRVVFTGGR